jgi:hypothetical protein
MPLPLDRPPQMLVNSSETKFYILNGRPPDALP